MRALRLRATQKRRFRPRTTDSRHLCPIAPNHLAERAQPPGLPGEVWQADITYVATREGWLYVAGMLDACSRRVVGWAADDNRPAGLVARAFERAVQARRPTSGLLHHSDRGSQYAGDAYRQLLRSHGVVPSMSRAGNCYDNAKMESFKGHAQRRVDPGPGLRFSRRGQERNLPLHRSLLQPHAAPRRARLHFTRGLREQPELNTHQPRTPTCPRFRGKIIVRSHPGVLRHLASVRRPCASRKDSVGFCFRDRGVIHPLVLLAARSSLPIFHEDGHSVEGVCPCTFRWRFRDHLFPGTVASLYLLGSLSRLADATWSKSKTKTKRTSKRGKFHGNDERSSVQPKACRKAIIHDKFKRPCQSLVTCLGGVATPTVHVSPVTPRCLRCSRSLFDQPFLPSTLPRFSPAQKHPATQKSSRV